MQNLCIVITTFNFIVITFYNVYNNYIQFSDFVIITLWLCDDICYSWERLLPLLIHNNMDNCLPLYLFISIE